MTDPGGLQPSSWLLVSQENLLRHISDIGVQRLVLLQPVIGTESHESGVDGVDVWAVGVTAGAS